MITFLFLVCPFIVWLCYEFKTAPYMEDEPIDKYSSEATSGPVGESESMRAGCVDGDTREEKPTSSA